MTLIHVSDTYQIGADALWRQVVRYDALETLMSGALIRVHCPRGEERVGDDVALVFRLFDVLPIGGWRFKVVARDDARRRLLSEERGTGVKRWVHEIVIHALPDGTARLDDTIEIDAGVLTPLVAWFARRDYARRHRLRKRMIQSPSPALGRERGRG